MGLARWVGCLLVTEEERWGDVTKHTVDRRPTTYHRRMRRSLHGEAPPCWGAAAWGWGAKFFRGGPPMGGGGLTEDLNVRHATAIC